MNIEKLLKKKNWKDLYSVGFAGFREADLRLLDGIYRAHTQQAYFLCVRHKEDEEGV